MLGTWYSRGRYASMPHFLLRKLPSCNHADLEDAHSTTCSTASSLLSRKQHFLLAWSVGFVHRYIVKHHVEQTPSSSIQNAPVRLVAELHYAHVASATTNLHFIMASGCYIYSRWTAVKKENFCHVNRCGAAARTDSNDLC